MKKGRFRGPSRFPLSLMGYRPRVEAFIED